MTTTSPEVAVRRSHREKVRDAAANTDVPAELGDNSSVSERAMTDRAHGTAAAVQNAGVGSSSGLSDDLKRSTNAATLPRVGPGLGSGTGDGARPQTGAQGTGQNQNRDGKTR